MKRTLGITYLTSASGRSGLIVRQTGSSPPESDSTTEGAASAGREIGRLAREHEAVLVVGVDGHRQRFLMELAASLEADRERMERLIGAMLPEQQVVSPAAAAQAQRNAAARERFLMEHDMLDSGAIAALRGSRAKNMSAAATRLTTAGRIFGVPVAGERRYPGFQFDDHGEPRPVVAPVLRRLRDAGLEGWEIALWFDTPSGWLDDRRPVDELNAADCAPLLAAAERAAQAAEG